MSGGAVNASNGGRLNDRASAGIRLACAIRPSTAALCALLALALSSPLYVPALDTETGHAGALSAARVHSPLLSKRGLLNLPTSAWAPISQALGADSVAYRIAGEGGVLRASNPAQRLDTRFSSAGVSLASGAAHLSMRLLSIGDGATLIPVGRSAPTAAANRVTYAHGSLSEWYANGPLGLEQGFTLARAPSAKAHGPLALTFAITANASLSLARGSQAITLARHGKTTLRYSGLSAIDAGGHRLRSWMALSGGRVELAIEARGARYPLRIDPFFKQGETLVGGAEAKGFGESVALSEHGDFAVIGAPKTTVGGQANAGAAYVFARAGTGSSETWTQEATLSGGGELGAGFFGHSVALSADGSTALIGGAFDNNSAGAAWVFARSGETWTQQGEKLTGAGEAGKPLFGGHVALSADGATALIGGQNDNISQGAAWVFTRSGETWTQQGEKLTGAGEVGHGNFGSDVALSADGNEALIGGRKDVPESKNILGRGAAWMFIRSAGLWTQQGSKLTGAGEIGNGELGGRVALSADGSTALIGGGRDNEAVGAAWVFVHSGESWTQQGGKLVQPTGAPSGFGGSGISLSGDGNTALIGARSAWVFTRTGMVWAQQGQVRTGTGSDFGGTVALSADGSLALVASGEETRGVGVFVNLPEGTLPEVSGVAPAGGHISGGDTVTISGSHFTGASAVKFGSAAAASFTVNSESSITAVSPPGTLGAVDVSVITPAGNSLPGSSDLFSYGPAVTRLTPNDGPTAGGETVTITGSDYTGVTGVKFGETPATSFTVNSESSITAVAPKGVTSGWVTVTNAEGTNPTGPVDVFYWLQPPNVRKIAPTTGTVSGGTIVRITGEHLFDGNYEHPREVKFGSVRATSVQYITPEGITVVSPPEAAGKVSLTVTTGGGTTSLLKYFKVLPTITSISPNHGPMAGGTGVTIVGTGFALGSKATLFTFGSNKGTSTTCASSTECTVVSPALPSAGAVDVTATVNKETSARVAADRFTYG
jgi:hypothetical protein